MKLFQYASLIALGILLILYSYRELSYSYTLFNEGDRISAVVTSDVDCGSKRIKGGFCRFEVEYECNKPICSRRFLTPFSMPFTGPEVGQKIELFWQRNRPPVRANFLSLWGYNLLVFVLGLTAIALGLKSVIDDYNQANT